MRLASAFVIGYLLLVRQIVDAGVMPEAAIRKVLDQQVAAWNQGDLKRFVSSYAAHCTLVGSTIAETTREQVLAHYRQKYPSPGALGKLAFSGLTIHLADSRVAMVTGHWHLQRDTGAGGPVGGVFSLLFELVDGSWQIALDHTS